MRPMTTQKVSTQRGSEQVLASSSDSVAICLGARAGARTVPLGRIPIKC